MKQRFYPNKIITLLALVAVLAMVLPADAIMLVSRSQEVSIGKQVQQQAIQQYGLSNDPAANQRVQRVGRRVAAVSNRRDVTYSYTVIDSNAINAFAAPGGPVMITERLVNMLPTDDELGFVLAHETGHIARQHGRDAINRALIASGLASLLFRNASSVVQSGVNIMYTLYDRGYSRDQEYQADTSGLQFMTRAGYNPEGAIKALAKLGMRRTSGVNKYLSTHPDIPDRINRIARMEGISSQRTQQLIRQAQTGG
ncbi:MAG: M48 family metalloprotease [Armatimonadetes bacterium]|nr:M48 family metalloprotease [Armatimonadota bacterium]